MAAQRPQEEAASFTVNEATDGRSSCVDGAALLSDAAFTYLQMPIHRVVAEALSLTWWSPNMEYALPGFGKLRFEQYIDAYTEWRFAQLEAAPR